jgi:signal transduction histidine kinase
MAWGNEGTVVLAGELESVAVPVRPGHLLVLLRKQPELRAFSNARTYGVLGAFWVISLALAAVLARGIVVPLRRLAARLPHIAEDGLEVLPEAGRADEIGQLARAYQETREQLAKERAAREQAERMATLGRMATGLAHEINNPVAAIRLHAQLLEGEAPDESLAMILSENAKIESLVNQWMFLARPQPPAVASCDLAGLVADCVRTVSPAASHSGVRIFQEVDGGCVVNGDRRRLGQAVVNILMNAIHAMSQGGELKVRGRLMEKGSVHLDFCDTGPGFSSEALAKATELFFSEKEGGMGIGLNVTAEIAKAHHGELRIANSGKGAVVSLILPKHESNL